MATTTLEQYKRKEFLKLGFSEYETRRLLESTGLGVSAVRELLAKGCTVRQAYRIYRP